MDKSWVTVVRSHIVLAFDCFDRILAVNTFGTLTVMLIAVHGFLVARPDFLDLALVYALINFIGTIAVTKYVGLKELDSEIDRHQGDI